MPLIAAACFRAALVVLRAGLGVVLRTRLGVVLRAGLRRGLRVVLRPGLRVVLRAGPRGRLGVVLRIWRMPLFGHNCPRG